MGGGAGVREGGAAVLYFHGGGYVFGSSDTHRAMLARLSAEAGLPACLPDYRLAPEHPFPAAIEDALAVWRAVAARPGGVILGGDSAGGGLALALLGGAAAGAAAAAGVFAFSPLTDFTFSGESLRENAEADVVLPASSAEEDRAALPAGCGGGRSPRLAALRRFHRRAAGLADRGRHGNPARRHAADGGAAAGAGGGGDREDRPRSAACLADFHNILPEARATPDDLAAWIRSL